MCIAVPGQIIDISNKDAIVSIMDVETTVNIQLINKPKIGDYVLVHAGCAIEKLDQVYFNDLSDIFKSILDEDESIDE
ncbi:HypC/HybG/HupF family hydrogenase formation chaperone [Clostridium sp. Cult2]|uniref:HypC/HybG/HupF family hydrogenase formation chaperone n=1 Tax=Clostridium sp. Cult2 TaxID=2079003 RepID=UPI001F314C17|nr:HypC/HybG/HupF family hydrogenase formation chaperone [Clostridium sp. Cult2]MCF6465166.1 HypC/HybG/HupF family hydrogenase formation chaperone [Clostridium sp. Cult2]